MAFGIRREELQEWKQRVKAGEIAFLTHYWLDGRFPEMRTVTKVGCADVDKLTKWGEQYGIPARALHMRSDYPHFDLFGERQEQILKQENMLEQLRRFQR